MKVFVDGVMSMCARLKDDLKNELDLLDNEGAEFIVGADYYYDGPIQECLLSEEISRATVYSMEGKSPYNAGAWPVVSVCEDKFFNSHVSHKTDLAMVFEADTAIIFWNRIYMAPKIFLNMLYMLSQGKEFTLITGQSKRYIIKKYFDLEPFLGHAKNYSESILNEGDWMEMLDTFMPSKAMRDYLITLPEEIYSRSLDIICGSPFSLEEKQTWLLNFASKENLLRRMLEMAIELNATPKNIADSVGSMVNDSFTNGYLEIKNALIELYNSHEGLYSLADLWFDSEILEEKENSGPVFMSFEKAVNHIRKEIREEGDGEPYCTESMTWYELNKWVSDCKGNLINTYRYYLFGDEVIYFDRLIYNDKLNCIVPDGRYSHHSMHLNLPVPFKPGDIVSFDCTPYAPKMKGLILEAGDNSDCCCLQALVKNEKGKWIKGAVKHASLFKGMVGLSPLYRIEYSEADLTDEYDIILETISKKINGNDEAGRCIWDKLNRRDEFRKGLTDKEIMEILC